MGGKTYTILILIQIPILLSLLCGVVIMINEIIYVGKDGKEEHDNHFSFLYTGWPRKNATLLRSIFSRNRGTELEVVYIIAYNILFPAR